MKKKIQIWLKRILWLLLIALVIAQFFRIDKTNPAAEPENDLIAIVHPPKEVADILRTSCYDCHSHHSVYPWYTNIAPFSWFIKNHINEAREHLNFSLWNTYSAKKAAHKLEEVWEEVEEGEMPMTSYLLMHNEARLSADQQAALVTWAKKMSGSNHEN